MVDSTPVYRAPVGPGRDAAAELLPAVYAELRRLAAARLTAERVDHTLQPTALVHEVWLRLSTRQNDGWQNSKQYLSAAAEAMRRVLIDFARQRQSLKRGGGRERLDLTDRKLAFEMSDEQLLALNDSLERLAAEDGDKAELIKLRFFAGLSHQQAADVLGISKATADRYWSYARVWLYVDMNPDAPA